MTINSFAARSIFKKTNNDALRTERRDPHRCVARDPSSKPGPREINLEKGCVVACPKIEPHAASAIKSDFLDFLRRMGVSPEPAEAIHVVFSLNESLGVRNCRYECRPGKIAVEGGDFAGLWAGLAWLEWEMRTRRGPFLPVGSFERRAAWPIQISQGPWGSNYSVPDLSAEYLSDDGFRLYAHYGVNTMMIHGDLLCYTQSGILPELNHPDYQVHIDMMKDASERALRYGVRLSYHVEAPKLRADHPVFQHHPDILGTGFKASTGMVHVLCSSNELTMAFYEETFSSLFASVPELAGITLIPYSESFFHCRTWDDKVEHPCPRCFAKPHEASLAPLLNRIARAVRKSQPRAYVGVWLYSVLSRFDRQAMFSNLSRDIAVFHQIDKDCMYKKNGYTKNVWDYSVDYIGPSPDAVKLAGFAHQTDRQLIIKTETGIGLEVCQFPYVPAMRRLADKWQNVRNLKPFGVHQAWFFFGMFGSRAEELGFWAAYACNIERDDYLRRMAMRDFGPEAADDVISSWDFMSSAMGHIPCVCLPYYFQGPGFLGPAHPLIPKKGMPIPEIFDVCSPKYSEETFYVGEARTSMVMHTLPDSFWGIVIPDREDQNPWAIILDEYRSAAADAEMALHHLQSAAGKTRTAADALQIKEELFLTELIWRTMLTCVNTVEFLRARRDYEQSGRLQSFSEMKRLAKMEKENALAAKPIYRQAPWLDLGEHYTDRKFSSSVGMIDIKLQIIDDFLEWAPKTV